MSKELIVGLSHDVLVYLLENVKAGRYSVEYTSQEIMRLVNAQSAKALPGPVPHEKNLKTKIDFSEEDFSDAKVRWIEGSR
jgi:hypothetical protein